MKIVLKVVGLLSTSSAVVSIHRLKISAFYGSEYLKAVPLQESETDDVMKLLRISFLSRIKFTIKISSRWTSKSKHKHAF